MSESTEQQALFQWAEIEKRIYPELELLYATPNGGQRNIATAVRLKKEGVKPGVSDVFLPVPRGVFHGLYIELKIKGGTISNNQKWWIEKTKEQGYCSVVCVGWEDAKETIIDYLSWKKV